MAGEGASWSFQSCPPSTRNLTGLFENRWFRTTDLPYSCLCRQHLWTVRYDNKATKWWLRGLQHGKGKKQLQLIYKFVQKWQNAMFTSQSHATWNTQWDRSRNYDSFLANCKQTRSICVLNHAVFKLPSLAPAVRFSARPSELILFLELFEGTSWRQGLIWKGSY